MTQQDAADVFNASAALRDLPTLPGVYTFFNREKEIIYVGKARNLKRRIASYFRSHHDSEKTEKLATEIAGLEVTVTHTESEALILENHLIKQHQPRYNIFLRDDKSYPYIYLSSHEDFPQLIFHRGPRRGAGRYFGPYPGAGAVRESLDLMQKLFLIRQCDNNFFRNRSRPCLQYQIKRCSAPCVEMVTPERYCQDIRRAVLFLEGRSSEVVRELGKAMTLAAENLEYEEAARLRDVIASLSRIQERQYVGGQKGNLDVVATKVSGDSAAVQLVMVRYGQVLGSRHYFPKIRNGASEAEVLAAFLSQHYYSGECPNEIVVNESLEERSLIEAGLAARAGHALKIKSSVRGHRARWLEMAQKNVDLALRARLTSRTSLLRRFEALQDALALAESPHRIECFDISHISGEATVAACVVFEREGPIKSDYRRFNISAVKAGDDYAALYQALQRRYLRIKQGQGKLPDLLLIDGGKGQVSQAQQVLQELQIDQVTIVGVAKGAARKSGKEQLFLSGKKVALILPGNSVALHLIQQIRDEAHRFAIAGHRARRSKSRKSSVLEQLPGIGRKRRQALLTQFGGLQELARAGVEDLARVSGISRALAQRIYDAFHPND